MLFFPLCITVICYFLTFVQADFSPPLRVLQCNNAEKVGNMSAYVQVIGFNQSLHFNVSWELLNETERVIQICQTLENSNRIGQSCSNGNKKFDCIPIYENTSFAVFDSLAVAADCTYKIEFLLKSVNKYVTCYYRTEGSYNFLLENTLILNARCQVDCIVRDNKLFHQKKLPPKINITEVESLPNEVIVHWSLPENVINSKLYPKLTLEYNHSTGQFYEEVDLDMSTQNGSRSFQTLLTGEKLFVAKLYDKEGCYSTESIVISSDRTEEPTQEPLSTYQLVSTILAIILALLGLACFLFAFVRKKMRIKARMKSTEAVINCIRRPFSANDERWRIILNQQYFAGDHEPSEIDPKSLNLLNMLGEGNFGKVSLAALRLQEGKEFLVAVKTSKSFYINIDKEVEVLKKVGNHPNIVQLIGYSTRKEPFCLIMEFVNGGDLLSYLLNVRKTLKATYNLDLQTHATNFTGYANLVYSSDNKELHWFAVQIARGMAHLELKAIVHRDLAARNILIDSTKTLKISDFGMAREGIYINEKRKHALPLRWMAPESFTGGKIHTIKSDVWSFGVVLWEIGTLGGFPYKGIHDKCFIHSVIECGTRLPQHPSISNELYETMLRCWNYNPDLRPSFAELEKGFRSSDQHVYMDLTHLEDVNDGYEIPLPSSDYFS